MEAFCKERILSSKYKAIQVDMFILELRFAKSARRVAINILPEISNRTSQPELVREGEKL